MNNLSIYQQILDNAPEGATHYDGEYLKRSKARMDEFNKFMEVENFVEQLLTDIAENLGVTLDELRDIPFVSFSPPSLSKVITPSPKHEHRGSLTNREKDYYRQFNKRGKHK